MLRWSLKPGDLIRWRDEYIDENDRDFYADKVGMIISVHDPSAPDAAQLFNILINGMQMRGFEYELELVDEAG